MKLDKLKNFKIANVPKNSLNNYWMNLVKINTNKVSKNYVIKYLNRKGINARPVWKLNHMQKPFKFYEKFKIQKSKILFDNSICLPSGLDITKSKINYIYKILKKLDNTKKN